MPSALLWVLADSSLFFGGTRSLHKRELPFTCSPCFAIATVSTVFGFWRLQRLLRHVNTPRSASVCCSLLAEKRCRCNRPAPSPCFHWLSVYRYLQLAWQHVLHRFGVQSLHVRTVSGLVHCIVMNSEASPGCDKRCAFYPSHAMNISFFSEPCSNAWLKMPPWFS